MRVARIAALVATTLVLGLAVWWGRPQEIASEPEAGRVFDETAAELGSPGVQPFVPTRAAAATALAGEQRLRRLVVVGPTGQPVAGALVTVLEQRTDSLRAARTDRTARTDARGEALLPAGGRSSCPLLIDHPTHALWVGVRAWDDDVTVVELSEAVTFRGRVVVLETGEPVAGARVVALTSWMDEPLDDGWPLECTTDARGGFAIGRVALDAVNLQVHRPGHVRHDEVVWSRSKPASTSRCTTCPREPYGSCSR